MRKVFVAVLVAAGVLVSGCAPAYYVRAVSANGTVVCQTSGGGVRTYRATGSQLRSIHIGDRCPN
jgi:hypothetical protein